MTEHIDAFARGVLDGPQVQGVDRARGPGRGPIGVRAPAPRRDARAWIDGPVAPDPAAGDAAAPPHRAAPGVPPRPGATGCALRVAAAAAAPGRLP